MVRIGVELELWVVDLDGRLCDGRLIAERHDRIEPEFVECLLEVKTDPHERERNLRRDLQSTLRAAIRAADAMDRRLVPLGTPLTATDEEATGERGRLFEEIYGDGVESAKNCAGTHVHFEKRNVHRQLNLLTALDPALALLNSSPYYRGELRMDSSRAMAYRRECGEEFRLFCDLWDYVGSVTEWTERVEEAYDQFQSLAAERGVPPAVVEKHFDPEDTVLNPVRLHRSQPTVEWRAPDAALPSQVVQIATDVGRLVDQTATKSIEFGSPGVREDCIHVPERSRLRGLSRSAIRSGTGVVPVRQYLRDMGFDLFAYRPISSELSGPRTIDETEARMLRLEQAQRMRADVESLTARSAVTNEDVLFA